MTTMTYGKGRDELRTAPTRQIAFVDAGVPEVGRLLAAANPEIAAHRVRSLEDIAGLLDGGRFDAVHIVAHGAPGALLFSSGAVTLDDLCAKAGTLARIGAAIAPAGDLMLWSCEVARGPSGERFADALEAATGVDVSASAGLVGAAALGGSWTLEHGPAVSPPPPFRAAAIETYPNVLIGRLYYTENYVQNSAGHSNLQQINADGTGGATVTTAAGAGREIVIDAATGRYWMLMNSGAGLADNGSLYTGLIGSSDAPTLVRNFAATPNENIDNISGLEIDPVNHHIYIGRTDYFDDNYVQNDATSGLLQLDYNPSTGAVSNETLIVNGTQASSPSSGYFFSADIGRNDSTGTLYFVDQTFGPGDNMIYRVDATNHTVTPLLMQSQFPQVGQLSPEGTNSNGIIRDVEVDGAHNLVYFSVSGYEYSNQYTDFELTTGADNHIYVISGSASGSTAASVVTLNGFSDPTFVPDNITLDPTGRILYVESEGNPDDTNGSDDKIFVFQLSSDGLSATYVRTLATFQNGQTFGNFEGLEFVANVAATLDLDGDNSSGVAGTGYQATHTEGGAATAIADVDVSIADQDDATVASATITVTNHSAGDLLAINGALPAGIVASSYNATTGVLTLTGSATLAAYQTALHQIVYSTTSDNPSGADRVITVILNDGTVDSTAATSTIHVTPTNDDPTANGDVLALDQRTTELGNVLTGGTPDSDPESDTLTVTSVTFNGASHALSGGSVSVDGDHGTLTIDSTGAYSYAANVEGAIAVGATAVDSFHYAISDGNGGTAEADLDVTVTGSATGASGNNVFLLTGPGTVATGLEGDDTYTVDNANDQTIEAYNGGDDTVLTSVSYMLTSGQEIEHLATTDAAGTAAINLSGNSYANELTGNAGANTLNGLIGDDTMIGLGGDDRYYATSGDVIVEQDGGGRDAVFASSDYTLSDNVENLYAFGKGGDAGVALTGNALNNYIYGGDGADTLTGLGGDDRYYVGAGDTVVEAQAGGTDSVYASASFTLSDNVENLYAFGSGGDAGVALTGNALANTIAGGAGGDTIVGGGGRDKLYGGAGHDTFLFHSVVDGASASFDTIYDFVAGTDTIDLHEIQAVSRAGADQAFDWIGTAAFSGTAGELHQRTALGNTIVEGDVNGDGHTDFRLVLAGQVNLTENDFIL